MLVLKKLVLDIVLHFGMWFLMNVTSKISENKKQTKKHEQIHKKPSIIILYSRLYVKLNHVKNHILCQVSFEFRLKTRANKLNLHFV